MSIKFEMMKSTLILTTLKCFCFSYGKLSLDKVKIFKITLFQGLKMFSLIYIVKALFLKN